MKFFQTSSRRRRAARRRVAAAALLLLAGAALPRLRRRVAVLGAVPRGARRARIEQSPHAQRGRFDNLRPVPTLLPGSLLQTLRAQLLGREQRRPPRPFRVAAAPPAFAAPADLEITWLGHSTTLVEIDGARLLTDPVWAEWASPLPYLGPRRFHPPPWTLDALPPLDAVVITHDHYDHLDAAAITALARRDVRWIAPLGVGAHLERWGVRPDLISECDWWEETTITTAAGATVRLRAVPTQHYSGRALGTNRALWAAWVVTGPQRRAFLGCDGGWSETFAEVGRRYGPFDLATVPIGQYGATWPHIHMLPEEAVAAAQALGAGVVVPLHWATFALAFHRWDEPAERFLAAATAAGLTVVWPQLGATVSLAGAEAAPPPWWRAVSASQ